MLARDAVHDARAVDPERPIDVRAGDGAVVLGDGDQLRQVLANLVRNALVHTPPGTPVEVSAQRLGEEVVLEVRDHGPGLPTDDADALFGRFWRAEGGRERGRAGAGLGLAIVAGIVAAHGGRVAARERRGRRRGVHGDAPGAPGAVAGPAGPLLRAGERVREALDNRRGRQPPHDREPAWGVGAPGRASRRPPARPPAPDGPPVRPR